MSDDDTRWMARAVELARQGWGRVHPNPMVGAVVVRNGAVIGEGYHQEHGEPHAEVNALRQAGAGARGATLYVSLEPCAHHGRTPPCTDAIIDAGIAEVVYATADPNTKAAGGAERLRQAGVKVTGGPGRDVARALNAAFFHVHEHGAPFVALKLAMSLDAGIASAPGVRTQITGPAAQVEMHRLRSGFDAILIGIGTALTDDPLLTVRAAPVRTPPVRIVLDSNARLPLTSKLVRSLADAPLRVICTEHADSDRVRSLENAGVSVLVCGADPDRRVDVRQALQLIAEQGIQTVFAEGGAALTAALLGHDLVQRIYIFLAPLFLGPGAVPAFGLTHPRRDRWLCTSTDWLGSDVLVTMDLPAD